MPNNLPPRLEKSRALLVVVDIQESFRDLIEGMPRVITNVSRLVRFWERLDLPVIFTEHYPQRLGATVRELSGLLPNHEPVEKISFSCAGDFRFMSRLEGYRRDQIVLTGIETHVCVCQTAFDLIDRGYQVAVAADAVSSRRGGNRLLGLGHMRDLGVQIMSAEMIMFEILKVARTEDFKAVAEILKENPGP